MLSFYTLGWFKMNVFLKEKVMPGYDDAFG
jgi:hypothetical protein